MNEIIWELFYWLAIILALAAGFLMRRFYKDEREILAAISLTVGLGLCVFAVFAVFAGRQYDGMLFGLLQ